MSRSILAVIGASIPNISGFCSTRWHARRHSLCSSRTMPCLGCLELFAQCVFHVGSSCLQSSYGAKFFPHIVAST